VGFFDFLFSRNSNEQQKYNGQSKKNHTRSPRGDKRVSSQK
jgi:hypothetical protein